MHIIDSTYLLISIIIIKKHCMCVCMHVCACMCVGVDVYIASFV